MPRAIALSFYISRYLQKIMERPLATRSRVVTKGETVTPILMRWPILSERRREDFKNVTVNGKCVYDQ